MDSCTYFFLIALALIVQGFYSMMELAAVSFNRVRLQFYVSQGNRRAQWLGFLLNHPTRLFGTTLIGINAAMQFGSECARRFYASIDLNPQWAPITQVLIVLIFAELAPMFAARRYAEHVAMLGIPLLYFTALIFRPVVAILDLVCRLIHFLFGVKTSSALYLSREELQKAIEAREDSLGEAFDPVLVNLFALKNKTAKDLMEPLEEMKSISLENSVGDLKDLLGLQPLPFIPVYHKNPRNIVGLVFPRDLLRQANETPLRSHCRFPWFITETTSVLEIIKAFRSNNQRLAIILGKERQAVGVLTLDAVVDEIFGDRKDWVSQNQGVCGRKNVFVARSFPASAPVSEVNESFRIDIPTEEGLTLEELMEKSLGRSIEDGDVVRVGSYELSVEEISLISKRTIFIRSVNQKKAREGKAKEL